MIKLSEEAKVNLGKFTGSDLYSRAKAIVVESVEVQVIGSSRSADQTALDLAVKEGVLMAFRRLENLALPQVTSTGAIAPRILEKRKNSNNTET